MNINCLLCDKEITFRSGFVTFITDKEGLIRHGTICQECYWTNKIKEE